MVILREDKSVKPGELKVRDKVVLRKQLKGARSPDMGDTGTVSGIGAGGEAIVVKWDKFNDRYTVRYDYLKKESASSTKKNLGEASSDTEKISVEEFMKTYNNVNVHNVMYFPYSSPTRLTHVVLGGSVLSFDGQDMDIKSKYAEISIRRSEITSIEATYYSRDISIEILTRQKATLLFTVTV
jgi:hypothetical protein